MQGRRSDGKRQIPARSTALIVDHLSSPVGLVVAVGVPLAVVAAAITVYCGLDSDMTVFAEAQDNVLTARQGN